MAVGAWFIKSLNFDGSGFLRFVLSYDVEELNYVEKDIEYMIGEDYNDNTHVKEQQFHYAAALNNFSRNSWRYPWIRSEAIYADCLPGIR